MDVLRHTGRAELASFLGGSQRRRRRRPVGLRALHRSRPRKADRRRCRQLYGAGRPAGGRRPRTTTSKGSTPTSPPPTLDPTLKPAEYALLDKPMEPWKPTDVDRDRLADRRHLRPRRRQRAELGADDAGLRRPDGQARPGARPGSASARRTTRSADDDLQALPVRDAKRLRQARPGAAGPGQRQRNADRHGLRRRRRRRPGHRSAPAHAAEARSKPAATPPTGSWSRPSTRPTATRSR